MGKYIIKSDPEILTYNNFINEDECKHIIDISKPFLKDSVVSDSKGGYKSDGRTSKTAWIEHEYDDITKEISRRVANVVNIPIENAERFQIVYYNTTNEYRAHYDSWEHDNSEKTLRCMKYGGARLITALVYLNNVEDGGETRFTKLDINVKPEIGKLLTFQNVKTNTNIKHPLSEHAGLPVKKGEKYIFNLWFRECPRSVLYSSFNPDYYSSPDKIKIGPNNKIHNVKNIFYYENFLTNNECNELINMFNNMFDNKKVTNNKYSTCWINNKKMPFIERLTKQIKLELDYLECFCIVKYDKKQVHGNFFDAYDVLSINGKKCIEKYGQRLQTISILLNNSIQYKFPKINLDVLCDPRSVIYYDNIIPNDIQQRDSEMVHMIHNNSDTEDTYLLNIYVREMDSKNNINKILMNKSSNNNEDFIKTYLHVLELFKENKICKNWGGYKSFKYTSRCEFGYFRDVIIKYKAQIDISNGLNRTLLDVDYKFDEYTPVVLNNVISKELLAIIQNYFRYSITNSVYQLGDRQANRYKCHNEQMSRFLQYEILPLIEHIVKKRLQPTYTYLSSYVKDSDLPAHTDRPDCEYTVSFLVGKDKNWPIYLDKMKQPLKHKGRYDYTPSKENCLALDGDSGGFIMFSGTDHIHFREKFTGSYYDILLLHYKHY